MSDFVQAFRDRVDSATREPGMAPPQPVEVRDLDADGVPARIYRPDGDDTPLLCYVHGAGFVAGDLDSHDQICRMLAARIPATVVAVDYRLAPEHPFPAPVDDTLRAVTWLSHHRAELGATTGPWALAGDSAGGTLVAVTAQHLAGDPDAPCLQALVCPALELADLDLDSHIEFESAEGFNTAVMRQMSDEYLPPGVDRTDPRVSPARHADVGAVAPAVIISAGLDPLRDDGETYGRRLIAAGVPVTMFRHLDMVHYGVHWCRAAPEIAPGLDVVVDSIAAALRRR